MIKVVENENTSKLTKSLLSMIRIYVVNLLMAEYAVETVSKEAIECLVMHLLKCTFGLFSYCSAYDQNKEGCLQSRANYS